MGFPKCPGPSLFGGILATMALHVSPATSAPPPAPAALCPGPTTIIDAPEFQGLEKGSGGSDPTAESKRIYSICAGGEQHDFLSFAAPELLAPRYFSLHLQDDKKGRSPSSIEIALEFFRPQYCQRL